MSQEHPAGMAAHFASERYLYESRWSSFWHQITCVLESRREGSLLEIGVGNRVVSYVLRQRFAVTTLDIDPDLAPDMVGDIRDVDRLFEGRLFDVVLCAEVLEHLPFDHFLPVLRKLSTITKENLIVGLPHAGPAFSFSVKLPLLPHWSRAFKLSWPVAHPPGGVHCWEIGKRGYPLRRICRAMQEAGFELTKTYIVAPSPMHRMFILRKTNR
jgi:hypothetical protein